MTKLNPCSTDASSSTTSDVSRATAHTSSNAHASTSTHTTTKTYSPGSSNPPGTSAPHTDQEADHSVHTPAHDYPNDSSTGNANAKTPATPATPSTPPSASTAHTANEAATSPSTQTTPPPTYVIDWNTISAHQATTILEIELPINWYGYSETEVANQLGTTTRHIREQRRTLRDSLT
jgi:hypothetical protein